MKLKKTPYCAIFNHFSFKFQIVEAQRKKVQINNLKKMNLVYECEIMLDICDKSNVVLYLDKYTGDVNV